MLFTDNHGMSPRRRSITNWLRLAGRLTFRAAVEFQDKRCSMMAAGLAYYALISASPLLVVAVAVAGSILGRNEAQEALIDRVDAMFGVDAAEAMSQLMNDVSLFSGSVTASLIAAAVLFFGATRTFAALQDSFDVIWDVPKSTSMRMGIIHILRSRLLAFVMVLAIGVVMLATMMLETLGSTIEMLLERNTHFDPDFGSATNELVSVLVRATCLAAIYRGLPACSITWRDVWLAGLLSSILLSFGHTLVGVYVAHSSVQSAYGAAGSLIVLLFAFYYAAFVVLLGAQFAKVYAAQRHTAGSLRQINET